MPQLTGKVPAVVTHPLSHWVSTMGHILSLSLFPSYLMGHIPWVTGSLPWDTSCLSLSPPISWDTSPGSLGLYHGTHLVSLSLPLSHGTHPLGHTPCLSLSLSTCISWQFDITEGVIILRMALWNL